MICPNCKRKFIVGKFCTECGTALVPDPSQLAEVPNAQATRAGETDQKLALFEEAKRYEFGIGVSPDMGKAFDLYYQSARKDNPLAMRHIGYLLFFGFGCMRDTDNAVHWLKAGENYASGYDSDYSVNAKFLLKLVNKEPFPYRDDQTRYNAVVKKISEYNQIANKLGYLPLILNGTRLQGIITDVITPHSKGYEGPHYLELSKSNTFSSINNSLIENLLMKRMGMLIRGIVVETIALNTQP